MVLGGSKQPRVVLGSPGWSRVALDGHRLSLTALKDIACREQGLWVVLSTKVILPVSQQDGVSGAGQQPLPTKILPQTQQ